MSSWNLKNERSTWEDRKTERVKGGQEKDVGGVNERIKKGRIIKFSNDLPKGEIAPDCLSSVSYL